MPFSSTGIRQYSFSVFNPQHPDRDGGQATSDCGKQIAALAEANAGTGNCHPPALRGVVEEFVTRDGTDHSPAEQRIETVLRQLAAGRVELDYDDETETCNILPMEDG